MKLQLICIRKVICHTTRERTNCLTHNLHNEELWENLMCLYVLNMPLRKFAFHTKNSLLTTPCLLSFLMLSFMYFSFTEMLKLTQGPMGSWECQNVLSPGAQRRHQNPVGFLIRPLKHTLNSEYFWCYCIPIHFNHLFSLVQTK